MSFRRAWQELKFAAGMIAFVTVLGYILSRCS